MPKNDDGEFELILGNKQLLSMFFVVVVLLGVFFVMGYIVGRNSVPLTADLSAPKSAPNPVAVNPAPTPSSPGTPVGSAAPASSAPAADSTAPAEKTTPPAETAKPESPKPEPVAHEATKAETKAETAKSKAAKEKAVAEEAPAKPAKSRASDQPVAGETYLQLTATTKHDADAMVDVLRKNGFKALDAQVPEKPGLYRVLVGPIPSGEVNKTKADLQSKSFEGNRAIKRVF